MKKLGSAGQTMFPTNNSSLLLYSGCLLFIRYGKPVIIILFRQKLLCTNFMLVETTVADVFNVLFEQCHAVFKKVPLLLLWYDSSRSGYA